MSLRRFYGWFADVGPGETTLSLRSVSVRSPAHGVHLRADSPGTVAAAITTEQRAGRVEMFAF